MATGNIRAAHARTREKNLVPAPAPATRDGQQLVPMPANRGQSSLADMPMCPPASQRGRQPTNASNEGDGRSVRATRMTGSDKEGNHQLAGAVDEDGGRSNKGGWWSNEGERRGQLTVVRWPRRHGLRFRKHKMGAPSAGDPDGVEAAEATMEGDLRSPSILHSSESLVGEWKALEMENAML